MIEKPTDDTQELPTRISMGILVWSYLLFIAFPILLIGFIASGDISEKNLHSEDTVITVNE